MPRNAACELCPLHENAANVSRRYPEGKDSRFPSKGCTCVRFWKNVGRTTPCWLWRGLFFKDRKGRPTYGYFWMNGRGVPAHKAAWIIFHGPAPKGLFVLHRCNRPACVRPEHMYLGTHEDNMRDRKASGGYPTGEGWRKQRAS